MKNLIIKVFLIFIITILLLGILNLLYNLFGNNSVNLKEITSSEREKILEVVGLNNINDNFELERLEKPKTYKDIYYILYFSMNLSNNQDRLNDRKIGNVDINFNKIEEKDNITKYRCTISNMGKSIQVLEQLIDKYKK